MSEGDEGGPSSGAAPAKPPLYPNHCTAHADVAVPGNCGDCKDQREANAAKPLTLVPGDTKHCLVHDEAYTRTCRGCRSDRIARKEETA